VKDLRAAGVQCRTLPHDSDSIRWGITHDDAGGKRWVGDYRDPTAFPMPGVIAEAGELRQSAK
jgi:hypothetical protein